MCPPLVWRHPKRQVPSRVAHTPPPEPPVFAPERIPRPRPPSRKTRPPMASTAPAPAAHRTAQGPGPSGADWSLARADGGQRWCQLGAEARQEGRAPLRAAAARALAGVRTTRPSRRTGGAHTPRQSPQRLSSRHRRCVQASCVLTKYFVYEIALQGRALLVFRTSCARIVPAGMCCTQPDRCPG